ncbi:MarR family transcriptional regulator [Castellaniella sp. MT123]|uniref:MarR family winged helix-turn-helix transcriptional regulator n=1 Tax=Castellaniella sp. MT123 TaxID=3140381 RepID=UPI0031F3C69A
MTSSPGPRARFGIRFSLLARRWHHVLDAHLVQAGLTGATWAPLIHLDETGGGMTQKDLALLVGVDGSSLVRVLDILERQGLIERQRSETDGRARLVHLTPEGKRHVADIRRELGQGERALLADLSDDEILVLLQCFDRIDSRITDLENTTTRNLHQRTTPDVR